MKKFNYQGAVIKDNNKISGVAYVLKRELKVEVKH